MSGSVCSGCECVAGLTAGWLRRRHMTYCYELHALCKDHSGGHQTTLSYIKLIDAPNTNVLEALLLLGLNVHMDHCQSLLINRYHLTGHYQSSVEAAAMHVLL